MGAWNNMSDLPSKQYRCGYCGFNVASNQGYHRGGPAAIVYVCPNCQKPTYFEDSQLQMPGVVPGNEVSHVPNDLEMLYREARNCSGCGAYTASVLVSRKMLMNISVTQGASQGQKFIEYVEYVASNGFIPPNGRGWVDHIRRKGNEATHEIALMTRADAEELIAFTEMLLKFIYEFPARVPSAP